MPDTNDNRVPRPATRNYLDHQGATMEGYNRMELAAGDADAVRPAVRHLRGGVSPVGPDGYPARLWDKRTGVIDPTVAECWREKYDLGHILRRDWDKGLGRKLEGKLDIYVGDMDNYYLNNAVYLVEELLESTRNPPYGGRWRTDRAEHCWNGNPTRPNATSRLRYHQMFLPRILERMKTKPLLPRRVGGQLEPC